MSDIRQIVSQCLDNDPAAMVHLMHRFRGRVFGLCYRMLGQWQDAEDAVQETFWRVSKHLRDWDARREFEPWLLTIAANRCRSALARRGRQLPTEPFLDDPSVDWSDQQREAAESLDEEVRRALRDLPSDWQTAFRLFHESQLGYQEIADRMDRPVGTVKTWVHRARKSLIENLSQREVLGGGDHRRR